MPRGGPCVAQGHRLRMRGGVGLRRDQVPSAGDEVLVAHHHRADRGVALDRASARLHHRDLHEPLVRIRHHRLRSLLRYREHIVTGGCRA